MSEDDKQQAGYDATITEDTGDSEDSLQATATDPIDSSGLDEHADTEPVSVNGDGNTEPMLEADSEERFPSPAPDLEMSPEPEDETPADGQPHVEAPASSAAPMDAETLAQLSTAVESLQAQLDERNRQYMRIGADFDNFRKRTAREKTDLEQRVRRDTISELLPVIDSFERARTHIKPQTEQEDDIHKSYQGVYKQLVECLKRIGVAPMRAKGKEFDPNLHEAVMREPTDQYDEGVVMEELVNGYLLGEQILRHAMVKVAAPPEPVLISEENNSESPDDSPAQ